MLTHLHLAAKLQPLQRAMIMGTIGIANFADKKPLFSRKKDD